MPTLQEKIEAQRAAKAAKAQMLAETHKRACEGMTGRVMLDAVVTVREPKAP